MTERELQAKISKMLESEGIRFEQEPAIGGVTPDFVIHGPGGKLLVIEAKSWSPRHGNTARAWKQVEAYKRATGARDALLVMADSKRNFWNKGVVNLEGLLPAVTDIFEKQERRKARRPLKRQDEKRTVFAAMPFDGIYDDTYFVAMSFAAEQVDAACKRVDKEEYTGDIVKEIKKLIRSSVAVIADLSESKPNVLYETGFAHALSKPTVHICSTPLKDLPFDVRNWNTIKYRVGQTNALKKPLAKRLKTIVG